MSTLTNKDGQTLEDYFIDNFSTYENSVYLLQLSVDQRNHLLAVAETIVQIKYGTTPTLDTNDPFFKAISENNLSKCIFSANQHLTPFIRLLLIVKENFTTYAFDQT